MACSDSMFLIEIIVEQLRSFVKCKDFIIKSQFADVFAITLKDPDACEPESPLLKRYPKRTKIIRKRINNKGFLETKPRTGQSALFATNVENLVTNMKKYPIELSLWSKLFPEYKLASTNISWHKKYINFLNHLQTEFADPQNIVNVKGEYNVFDEFTSRRMAAVKLNIKLSCLANKITTGLSYQYENAPDTFLYTGQNAALANGSFILPESAGIIKTIYSGGKKTKIPMLKFTRSNSDDEVKKNSAAKISEPKIKTEEPSDINNINNSLCLVKSQVDLDKNKQIHLVKSKSCSSMHQDQLNILNYIFGENAGPLGNQVYCVSYFTVENENIDDPKSSSKSSPKEISDVSSKTSEKDMATTPTTEDTSGKKMKLKFCHPHCAVNPEYTGSVDLSTYSLDIPKEAEGFTSITKCNQIDCKHKQFRQLPPPPDDRILLDVTNLKKDCCEKVEEVVGGVKAKLKIGELDPCYCECECSFGFTKKTRYCKICRGYEILGEELGEMRANEMPFPCPVYHNLTEKLKQKTSNTGSDNKRVVKSKSLEKKSIDSEKEPKKGKKKKKEDKFKFNYGYTAPQIGHSRCALPCTGTLGQVPRNMGWLWTADNIPGLKFRPAWKPGAVNKHVLRLLKIAKNPNEVFAKKKRKRAVGKSKRPLKRPLLIVHKKDGEYTVNLETMKSYNKPRAINQVPYEDKDPITYTVGRTDEENYQRRKKKERARRRLEREQREFIQSAFRDMCEEICLKTYQQALGILPDAEKPDCTCYPAEPGADRTDLNHSCSCSEDSVLSFSDTDSDEWMVEITPPIAAFDSTYKSKKVAMADSETQYTYLDYRVKLLDRYGNPVPRFFTGPDGKQECSDLGGFWDADHKNWLDINIDGYIGPDGRWAPNTFLGPNGEQVDGEAGKFQIANGSWLVVGIDGYVDVDGKWRYYSKTEQTNKKRRQSDCRKNQEKGESPVCKQEKHVKREKHEKHDKREKHEKREKHVKHAKSRKQCNKELTDKKSNATWSCFGDASVKYLSEMGIMGHGHDRQLLLDTLKKLITQGENVKIPERINVPRSNKKPLKIRHHNDYHDNTKCRHATPSSKGVLAVDEDGNHIYFRIKDSKNVRPAQRIATLTDQGISLSSFHVPCFHSFINNEMIKRRRKRSLWDSDKLSEKLRASPEGGKRYHSAMV